MTGRITMAKLQEYLDEATGSTALQIAKGEGYFYFHLNDDVVNGSAVCSLELPPSISCYALRHMSARSWQIELDHAVGLWRHQMNLAEAEEQSHDIDPDEQYQSEQAHENGEVYIDRYGDSV